jgi:hypothetical protein
MFTAVGLFVAILSTLGLALEERESLLMVLGCILISWALVRLHSRLIDGLTILVLMIGAVDFGLAFSVMRVSGLFR